MREAQHELWYLQVRNYRLGPARPHIKTDKDQDEMEEDWQVDMSYGHQGRTLSRPVITDIITISQTTSSLYFIQDLPELRSAESPGSCLPTLSQRGRKINLPVIRIWSVAGGREGRGGGLNLIGQIRPHDLGMTGG